MVKGSSPLQGSSFWKFSGKLSGNFRKVVGGFLERLSGNFLKPKVTSSISGNQKWRHQPHNYRSLPVLHVSPQYSVPRTGRDLCERDTILWADMKYRKWSIVMGSTTHRKLKTSQLSKLLQYSDFFSAITAIVTIIWKLCYSLHCLNYKWSCISRYTVFVFSEKKESAVVPHWYSPMNFLTLSGPCTLMASRIICPRLERYCNIIFAVLFYEWEMCILHTGQSLVMTTLYSKWQWNDADVTVPDH